MYQALEDLKIFQRKDHVQQLQTIAIATNAGMGSKESIKQIEQIARECQVEAQQESTGPGAPIPLLEMMQDVN